MKASDGSGIPFNLSNAAGLFDGNPDWAPDGRPVCPDSTVNTTRNTPVTFTVTCRDRKPANVMLVVDVSGSMEQENRLSNAKNGLGVFFDEVAPNDRLGLTSFSDQIKTLVPVEGRFHSVEEELRATVQTLSADGGTSVYDATAEALKDVRALDDETRINAIVVLTDGDDTDSNLGATDIIDLVSNQDDSAPHVRVFTIAYSADAAGAARYLKDIATGSGGQAYTGSTENIEAVYRSISSFF
jgi:Ca-activated chloride channel homolog